MLVVVVTAALCWWHSATPVPATVPIEVVGDVPHPGWYALTPPATVDAAVALAGGASDTALLVGDAARVRVHRDGSVRLERGAPLLAGQRVDLNRDDRQALMHLPGVGASTAQRLTAAQALQTPHDMLDTRGVGPTLFTAVHPLVWTPSPPPRPAPTPVNFNTDDASRLVDLPGVGPVLAGRIVEERVAAGPFESARDLRRVHGIGPTKAAALAAVGVFE